MHLQITIFTSDLEFRIEGGLMYRKSLWLVTLTSAPLLFGSLLLNARTPQEQSTNEKTQSSQDESKDKKPKDGLDKKRTSTRYTVPARDVERSKTTGGNAAADRADQSAKTGTHDAGKGTKVAAKDTEKGAKVAAKDTEKAAKKTGSMNKANKRDESAEQMKKADDKKD
jgi:hypothetical protein